MKLLIRIPPTPRGCGFPAHAMKGGINVAYLPIFCNDFNKSIKTTIFQSHDDCHGLQVF